MSGVIEAISDLVFGTVTWHSSIGSITVTVVFQAAVSGESGEEWSILHCNTEYSHGIMCYS